MTTKKQLPEDLLPIRRVLNDRNETPPGSSGFAYGFEKLDEEFVRISDAQHTARFWIAEYDAEFDCWRVISDGEQWKDGRIVEYFEQYHDFDDQPDELPEEINAIIAEAEQESAWYDKFQTSSPFVLIAV